MDWLQPSRKNPVLGNGAFAKIYGVEERRIGGESFAVKVMSRHDFSVRGIEAQIENEVAAMRRAADAPWCTNIVKLIDTAEERGIVYLLLELCQYDLLRHMGMQPSGRLTEVDARRWTRQLLLGLRDLHSFGIIHRDVKPENLLCARDGKLKIADFGWCCNLVSSGTTSMAGTFHYMSPEVFEGEVSQTEATDVWSTGMTLYQLLTGKNLLNADIGPGTTGLSQCDPNAATDERKKRMLDEIMRCCPPKDQDRPGYEEGATWAISPLCWDLLQRMLDPDPLQRIQVHEALQHPWFPKSMVQVTSAILNLTCSS
jgi:serine/threonine protein kinase